MSVNFKPTSTIIADLGLSPDGKALNFTANTCAKHMDKYVPFRPGSGAHLRQYRIQNNSIIYGDNGANFYAKYQYYGVRKDGTHKVTHYTTPGTGPYWDKRMWSAEQDKVIKEVQSYIEHGGK